MTASLAAVQTELVGWKDTASEAREEIESLKLHIEALQNEKVQS